MATFDDPARIRELRVAIGLTQEEFARELGVSFTTVSRWENGHGTPSPLPQRRLQELLDRVHARKATAIRKGTT